MMLDEIEVSVAEMARLLSLSPKEIYELKKAGILVRASGDRLKLAASVTNYIVMLRGAALKKIITIPMASRTSRNGAQPRCRPRPRRSGRGIASAENSARSRRAGPSNAVSGLGTGSIPAGRPDATGATRLM